LAACRRVEAGAWKVKTDRGGAPVYLHRLDGETRQGYRVLSRVLVKTFSK
jgi:hypothetical protein